MPENLDIRPLATWIRTFDPNNMTLLERKGDFISYPRPIMLKAVP